MGDKDEINKRVERALKEIELIRKGDLPKRPAREMIERVRGRLNSDK